MGIGYEVKCLKCYYANDFMLGDGFSYEENHREIINKIQKGEYGNQHINFLNDHSNGLITTERVVIRCSCCDELYSAPELSMYIPDENHKNMGWNFYYPLFHGTFEDRFEIFRKYRHVCKRCGGPATVVEDFENKLNTGEIICPRCKNVITESCKYFWD